MGAVSLGFVGVVGILARGLIMIPEMHEMAAKRVEFSVPPNSFRRVSEGLFLMESGVDPYSGDTFHETPLCLLFFSKLRNAGAENLHAVLFPLCDVTTAFFLYFFSRNLMEQTIIRQEKMKLGFAAGSSSLLLGFDLITSLPKLVVLAYLCNPFLIGSCLAKTTTVFTNLLLAAMLFFSSIAGNFAYRWIALLCLVLATYQTMYMALLFPALHLYLERVSKLEEKFNVLSALLDLVVFGTFLGTILVFSAIYMGSWSFLRGVYGFLIMSPDYTPNIGLFWYFFTEMFDQFRTFFVWIFFMNVCIYSFPVSVKLRHDPTFAILILLPLVTIFKPYPSFGEVGFYLSLLPLWLHLAQYMRQKLVISIMVVIPTILFPVLWKLWIEVGSANANFIYAITLVFVTSQVFLVTDLFIAHEKREWHLKNGIEVKNENGEELQLNLE